VSIDDDIGTFGATSNGAVSGADSFNQWYKDVMGTNLSKHHTIALHRDGQGIYEYLTDDFFPIDGQLLGNEGASHNNFFTYTISADFTHDGCTGRFFEFDGSDDCWVFIDNELVLDIGGIATPSPQHIALARLDLEEGNDYRLEFFFAHRRNGPNSTFRLRTNIPLTTNRGVPVTGSYD